MSDETIEEKPGLDTSTHLKEASAKFQEAYKAALQLRSDFGRKRGYVRKKEADEQAYHQVKPQFGEFRPFNRELMEKNTNNGKGVDVQLPDGAKVHLDNQAQLYDKIVQFNKERGDFYDERHIASKNPKDYTRLKNVNEELEAARETVIKAHSKRGEAFKTISALEKETKAEFDENKAARKSKRAPRKESASREDATANKPDQATDKEVKTTMSEDTPKTAAKDQAVADKPSAPIATNDPKHKVEMEEVPVAEIALSETTPLNWVREQDDKASSHMRHMMVLSFLQEDRFSAEREHFYNEVHKRFGKEIESVKDAEDYVARLMSSRQSDAILRDTAPGAVAATKEYINSMDMDKSFTEAGYSLNRVTPEFREKMQITQAYANRIGGEEGHKSFMSALKEHKDSFMRGLGDPRVGLAISGTMLGMGVMAGTGPAGLVIGGLKFANKLLQTEAGKEFQRNLYESSVKFMEKLGVKPEITEAVTNSIQDLWKKTVGSKWGKVAMYGAAAMAIVSFGPSAMEVSPAHAASVPLPDTDLPTPIADIPSPPVHPATVPDVPSVSDNLPDSPSGASELPVVPLDTAYDVKAGDSLWNIAKDAYMQAHPGEAPNNIQLINMVNEIAQHNDISNPNLIYAGKTIHIPGGFEPSPEVVSGPTNWLKDQASGAVSRLDGLNDRTQEWRQDHKIDQEPSLPRGMMRV